MGNLHISETIKAQAEPLSLDALGLVNAPSEAVFLSVTRLAARIFDTPVALVAIDDRDNDRQFFAAQLGLPEPYATSRQAPLGHSFCRHVTANDAPLVVPYAPDHALVSDKPAISDLNLVSYLGVPLHGPDNNPLGALCVMDDARRDWTAADISTLQDLAACIDDEIALRAAVLVTQAQNAQIQEMTTKTKRHTALREAIASAFVAPGLSQTERFTAMLNAAAGALGMTSGAIYQSVGAGFVQVYTTGRPSVLCKGLSASIIAGSHIASYVDLTAAPQYLKDSAGPKIPSSFIGAPLVLDGMTYGTLEFHGDQPRDHDWQPEEISIVSIVAMMAATYIELYGQISTLKQSETALVKYVMDLKSRGRLGDCHSALPN